MDCDPSDEGQTCCCEEALEGAVAIVEGPSVNCRWCRLRLRSRGIDVGVVIWVVSIPGVGFLIHVCGSVCRS